MIKKEFHDYFKGVKSKFSSGTEFTPRTDLENLLNIVKPSKDIKIIQEPRKEDGIKGRPDFKVEINGLTVGYIETKAIDIPLDDIIEKRLRRDSEQLEKYLKVIPNLILTNYKEFILFRNGVPVDRGLLFYPATDKKLDINNVPKISKILDTFFSVTPESITSAKKLSHLLADRTRLFKEFLGDFIENGEDNDFKLKLVGAGGLHDVIKETLIEELSLHDFIDAYVQTITYGLFLAELNSKNKITEENASRSIPKSMGILKELFKTIDIEDIPDSIDWIIEEIIDILNLVDQEKIKSNLAFSKLYQDEDPYVYFYENFLGAYDKKNRKAKGVYYTPIPVVKFIIESIDYLIRQNFNKEGLKGDNVKVLDFATGTGTFLLEAFIKALENTDEGMKQGLIRERLLKNFYGFEYLIPPYTIAHLKLSQYLKDEGYPLQDDERLKIYLTDTLDNSKHEGISFFQKITKEGHDANQIKLQENVLVLMGNPPYSNFSSGDEKEGQQWIKDLLDDYKKGLNEKKINIDDDYIKFLRYAQWKVEQNGYGIVGIITNNSYLDGITHKIMRKSILETFDQIYILNLHGNKLKEEPDDNVFDIMVGVSIVLFIKLPKKSENPTINYYSTMDNGLMDRELKYGFLLANDVSSLTWEKLNPIEPNYWFVNKDLKGEVDYIKYPKITEIFNINGSGIQTDRNDLFIGYDKNEISGRIKKLLSGDYDEDFTNKYRVINSSSYPLLDRIKNKVFDENSIEKILYRPFDTRLIYYQIGITSRPGKKIMKHFIKNPNIGLVFTRQIISNEWKHVFVTDKIVDREIISTKTRERGYLAPLYLINEDQKSQSQTSFLESKEYFDQYKNLDFRPNFQKGFIKYIYTKYETIPSPEDIFGYIYAILHSETYREKYKEFLKTDFPRIPFIDNLDQFKELSRLGNELIEVHLLRKDFVDSDLACYIVDGNDIIDKIKYDDKNFRLFINQDQYFENVPENVWNIEIGGYKVIYKWLKYRRGRNLSFGDINHFQKVVRSLSDTILIMNKIDQIITF